MFSEWFIFRVLIYNINIELFSNCGKVNINVICDFLVIKNQELNRAKNLFFMARNTTEKLNAMFSSDHDFTNSSERNKEED